MANQILYDSSLLLGNVNLFVVFTSIYTPLLFKLIVIFGVLTSIWNHGSTSTIAKKMDRCVMVLGILGDFYYIIYQFYPLFILQLILIVLITTAIHFYILAKMCISATNRISYHIYSHCAVTLCHILMALSFTYQEVRTRNVFKI